MDPPRAGCASRGALPRSSGSETRQRPAVIAARLTEAEHAAVIERAAAAGLPVSSYIRAAALGAAGERVPRRRRPSVGVSVEDARILARVLTHAGKIGNNLNQIARRLHQSDRQPEADMMRAMWAELVDMRTALMAALGRGSVPPEQ